MKKLLLSLSLVAVAAGVAFGQNYKIRQVQTIAGQRIESTVYVKGSRKRTEGGGFMGMGGDVADVEQCDLKRNLKINDKKKLYAVEPFADGVDETPVKAIPKSTPAPRQPVTKGGTVTMTANTVDTGERKQMFGLTARRIKTSMSMTASPDACMKGEMSVETDGWYVDLPQFSCPMTSYRRPTPPTPQARQSGGCRDRMIVRGSGAAKTGFALVETTTMKSPGMSESMTTTVETIEFSKATLADTLFDIPEGYSLVESSDDLYGKPDMAAMMRGAMGGDDTRVPPQAQAPPTSRPKPPAMKPPGTIRVGVLAPTNNGGENISITNMQAFLAQKLTTGKVEGVPVGNLDDARAASCDFVLSSDFSKLKQSAGSKVGGLLGKVTNTDTSSMRNYDAQVEFVLTSVADGKSVLKSKSSDKGQNNVDRAAEAVLAMEALQVLGTVKK